MLHFHFKSSLRTFGKNKVFSLINIIGLSVGVSAALVIYLLVSFDFSFDKFQKDGDRIYRVVTDATVMDQTAHISGVTYPMAAAVRNEIAGVEAVIHFYAVDNDARTKIIIPANGNDAPAVFGNQEDIIFADSSFFSFIPYRFLAGSASRPFDGSNQVVLTQSVSNLYFPGTNPGDVIGREIIINDTVRAIIKGVVRDFDRPTDFSFKIFISKQTLESRLLDISEQITWGGANSASQLLIKLSKDKKPGDVASQLNALYSNNRKPGRVTFAVSLQPLAEIHFDSVYSTPFVKRLAHQPTLYGMILVAVFLVVLACINFINLTTAQAIARAKEIGIRKTMGSSRKQLIIQFMGEAFLLTVAAALLSLAAVPGLLHIFDEFIPGGFRFELTEKVMLVLALIVLAVTVLSGFYPAVVLSSLKPASAIKDKGVHSKEKSVWLRKGFTVSQFVIAQVFIIGTIVVSQQLRYAVDKDLGFEKDAIIYLRTDGASVDPAQRSVFLDKVKAIAEVSQVSLASDPPSIDGAWMNTFTYRSEKQEIETPVQVKRADSAYLGLFGIKLIAGKNLSNSGTTKELLINETYSRILHFSNPQDAIGKMVSWDNNSYAIAGVIADFHQRSLHESITPLVLASGTEDMAEVNIALYSMDAAKWNSAIRKIEKVWKEVYPASVFEFRFLDDTVREFYVAEQKVSSLLKWSSALTIFISCLGLFGLLSYVAHRRRKEIGIRKVLGADVSSIVVLFSKDFMVLVVIAICIATPMAFALASSWLQNFAYRIDLAWWMFLLAGLLTVLIAAVTIGLQAFRAALTNPLISLRRE
jgi:ABC-type antimicrobial peptide transport system permease subunit